MVCCCVLLNRCPCVLARRVAFRYYMLLWCVVVAVAYGFFRCFVPCAASVCWRVCWSMWRLLLSGVAAVCCFVLADAVRCCCGWFVLFVAVVLLVVCCYLLLVIVAVWCLFGGIV